MNYGVLAQAHLVLCNPLMVVIKVKVAFEYISVSDKKRGWAASASPAVVGVLWEGGGLITSHSCRHQLTVEKPGTSTPN